MKSLNRAIDRFCYKHPRFGIPNLMMFVVVGTVFVYLFNLMDTTNTFMELMYFSPYHILRGQVWRLITFVFVPTDSNLIYLALFLYLYYFIGSTLEREWGTAKFTFYYLSGMLLTVLYGFILYFISGGYTFYYFTSTYINLSMFFAFATLFPDMRLLLFFIIPIKIKWLAMLNGAFFLYSILANMAAFPYNLLPLIALLNFIVFCGGYLIDAVRPTYKGKTSKSAINFKKAAKEIQREQKNKPYNRKCAVCGKTDTEYPDLEFRYCSRCEGYHCFCLDHINNHVHFDK